MGRQQCVELLKQQGSSRQLRYLQRLDVYPEGEEAKEKGEAGAVEHGQAYQRENAHTKHLSPMSKIV